MCCMLYAKIKLQQLNFCGPYSFINNFVQNVFIIVFNGSFFKYKP
jgi:hypothetical protein